MSHGFETAPRKAAQQKAGPRINCGRVSAGSEFPADFSTGDF